MHGFYFIAILYIYLSIRPTKPRKQRHRERQGRFCSVRAKLVMALVQRFVVTEEEHHQIRDDPLDSSLEAVAMNKGFNSQLSP